MYVYLHIIANTIPKKEVQPIDICRRYLCGCFIIIIIIIFLFTTYNFIIFAYYAYIVNTPNIPFVRTYNMYIYTCGNTIPIRSTYISIAIRPGFEISAYSSHHHWP